MDLEERSLENHSNTAPSLVNINLGREIALFRGIGGDFAERCAFVLVHVIMKPYSHRFV